MSHYWGAKCLDCNAESRHSFNHGKDCVQKIIDCAPLLKELFLKCDWRLEVKFMGDYEHVMDFVLEHDGHRLKPASEYGEKYDDE